MFYLLPTGKGYNLTYRSPKDSDGPPLIEHDLPKFSHVVVVGGDVKCRFNLVPIFQSIIQTHLLVVAFAKDINPQTLVGLLSGNTNLILALGSKQNILTSLAPEFGLILPPPNTNLVSHFPEREDPISTVPISPPREEQSKIPLTSTINAKSPISFSGMSFALSNNPRLFPILSAPEESFAGDIDLTSNALADAVEKGGEGLWAGSKMAVAAGFQAKGGARVVWLGGSSLLSNRSPNHHFANDVAAWAFQETNVLRIDSASHKLVKGVGASGNGRIGQPQEQYTVGDEIEFTVRISKYNPKFKVWEACHSLTDLQLEFTMLDPHIRIGLPPSPGRDGKREKGVYRTTFKAPDRHGVFKFIVDYRRSGWTELKFTETIPVVPKRHDGYERWLSSAWPYYAGAISTSVGFVVFAAVWLGSADERGKGKKKAE
ncbi:hypothetical protein E1B28_007466 [Marasmius oreades]|uniref:Dolichyl-diphosphooligosaccharide--protein glycosyltransferase subunit WBP1 n=1 Tax=Marasmius oreades TaxID=181124 RepID=A0A9P7UTH5_9AGAR|nr:uncharacterized protein E1B28_007466 [Marasmius oreades]KAG7093827.1 hypothetical protein E1B28_007466 [Marasmius oreades]